MNNIKDKIKKDTNFVSLNTIMVPYSDYTLSEMFWDVYPDKKVEVEYIAQNRDSLTQEEKKGKLSNLRILTTNIFELLSEKNWGEQLFYTTKPDDGEEYVCLKGLLNRERCERYIKGIYINTGSNYSKYKVILPKSNGSGSLGETLSTPMVGQPMVGQPMVGYTQSFLGIGAFNTEQEVFACYKYVCTKFCRTLLGILKITQDNPPEKWAYVPLQDFTTNSDIDWSKSIKEIDEQLYKKYNLSEEEIQFIETHVKEMA